MGGWNNIFLREHEKPHGDTQRECETFKIIFFARVNQQNEEKQQKYTYHMLMLFRFYFVNWLGQ